MSKSTFVRLSWIGIVLAGFGFSGYLINNLLDNWNQNPVETTISTYPIEKVTFPKIIVCPPKHTYTNLNFDIVHTNNASLSGEQIEDLKTLIDEKIEQAGYENIMLQVNNTGEQNQFYNWYTGLSKIEIPYFSYPHGVRTHRIKQHTYAREGIFRSPYFGEKFQKDKMIYPANYDYNIYIKRIGDIPAHFKMSRKLKSEIIDIRPK